ncbi:MAG TPA: Rieske (2Fe-2S) protein [Kofleriaceae bacterium]|nr:Rieske (2Fe-2S) protein [Kofleriaceae bacterium]
MPPQASLRALACDLMGAPWEELDDAGDARRPTVAEAARRCPRGQVVAAREGGRDLAVCVLEDGRVFALPDRCPHDGGRLSDGFVERGRLVCSRHGWELDPATGRRIRNENLSRSG